MRRRQFTQFIALLTGGVAASAYAGIPAPRRLLQTGAAREDFSRDMFSRRIGGTFRLRDQGSRHLVLKGIEEAACDRHCDQFCLVFELSPGSRLEEGIHSLECGDGSRMDLYLIPSARGAAQQQLVSFFNLKPAF